MVRFFLNFVLIMVAVFSRGAVSLPHHEVKSILTLNVDASINPATYDYLKAGYSLAEHNDYDLVLLTLNTPGGLVSTTKNIITLIGDSAVPTAIWIAPEGASATSAGAIIASGAHILLMAEGSNIGAATPVELGEDIASKDLRAKAVNDLVALVTSLAEVRGRNKEHYAKMVKEAASYTAHEALAKGLIDGIAHSRGEVVKFIHGKSVSIRGEKLELRALDPTFTPHEMDFGQKLLNIFADPTVAYVLFILGVALLYFELQAPGSFIAGSLGVLCLLLAGVGFQLIPINFGGLGLLLLGLVLFALEAYITSFGLLALAGIASLIVGSLLLFRSDETYIEFSKIFIVASSLAIGLFMAGISLFIWRDRRKIKRAKNYYSLVGKPATIVEVLPKEHPGLYAYQIRVEGETWKATSTTPYQLGSHCIVKQDPDDTMIVGI
jgi:membrane-bound serine protease (ClpP class)